MNKTACWCAAFMLLASFPCLAARKWKDYAPLPPEILSAKTAYLNEASFELNDAYSALKRWGRFDVVTDPDKENKANLVLTFTPFDSRGVCLGVNDASTGAQLYFTCARAFLPRNAVRGVVRKLRYRIEATEEAALTENVIRFQTKMITFSEDTAALKKGLARLPASNADSWKQQATAWRGVAEGISVGRAKLEKQFANVTVDELAGGYEKGYLAKWFSGLLISTCSMLAKETESDHTLEGIRANFPPDVAATLSKVETDEVTLKPDCARRQAQSPTMNNGQKAKAQ